MVHSNMQPQDSFEICSISGAPVLTRLDDLPARAFHLETTARIREVHGASHG